jgi:hypothetical protein
MLEHFHNVSMEWQNWGPLPVSSLQADAMPSVELVELLRLADPSGMHFLFLAHTTLGRLLALHHCLGALFQAIEWQ